MDIHEQREPLNRVRMARPYCWYRFPLFCLLPLIPLLLSGFNADRCEGGVNQADHPPAATGRVIDDTTNLPLPGATVTLNRAEVVLSDDNGLFRIDYPLNHVGARAPGFTRAEMTVTAESSAQPVELRLKPIRPKALYLTVYGVNSRIIRGKALELVDGTELNALVIDMKGDRGIIPYPSDIPLAADIGAQKLRLVKDIKGLIRSLKEKGIYTIARIVVFKDDILGSARPDLAVRTTAGAIWRDRENLIWVDPSKKEVWDYNIAIAIEAAQNGFDEIQFDYVRFPDRRGLKFDIANTEENRIGKIDGFLTEARKKLLPYNVFLAADIFGYVAWNLDDTQIGQKIDRLAPAVDYISLMLYPSGFHLGIPKYRNPVANVYKTVYLSLKKAQERTRLPTVRFRPWLQAFRDYAFDRRPFSGIEIREQIKAAEDFGSDGWMLWNPRNSYIPDGLKHDTDPLL
ncbi:MAG: hypothetical protein ACD_75C02229G0002 [uncultured bacterium]|nr:MAG: hypothetical protein ACD_75C02229G0002 [uncultured bacterium]